MNVVIFAGNLGADLDLRYGENGFAEGAFSVASKEYDGRDEKTQEPKYWTTWANCVLRGKRAEALQDELYKGRFVTVQGRLRSRMYKGEGDKNHTYTYILVDEVEFDRRAVRAAPAPQEGGRGS